MKKTQITPRNIAITGILLAICIVSQFFKNLSVYITGPIINTILIISVLTVGIGCSLILCILTPLTSFFITGSPIMAAIPLMFPAIMAGNAILIISIYLLKDRLGKKIGLPLSMIIGSLLKGAFMGVVISLLILPNKLPEPMLPKLTALQTQFSITQIITSLIGSVVAYVIWLRIRNVIKDNED